MREELKAQRGLSTLLASSTKKTIAWISGTVHKTGTSPGPRLTSPTAACIRRATYVVGETKARALSKGSGRSSSG